MSTLLSYTGAFIETLTALVFWELMKQAGVTLLKTHAPDAVARGLFILDTVLPKFIAEGVTSAELEGKLRTYLGTLSPADWRQIKRQFDPEIFLAHQQDPPSTAKS